MSQEPNIFYTYLIQFNSIQWIHHCIDPKPKNAIAMHCTYTKESLMLRPLASSHSERESDERPDIPLGKCTGFRRTNRLLCFITAKVKKIPRLSHSRDGLIGFPIRTSQQAFLAIEMEVAAAVPAEVPLNSGSILQDIKQHDHADDQDGKRKVRMISAKVSNLKENILKRANC